MSDHEANTDNKANAPEPNPALTQGEPKDGDQDAAQEKARKPKSKKSLMARMFAEAIASEAHQPDTARAGLIADAGNLSDGVRTEGDDSGDERQPREPPKKTEAEEQELLHIKVDEEEIEINNVRLFSFTEIELERLTNCLHLGLRKNLLHQLSPTFPDSLANRLVVLDLFDNKIRKIPPDFFKNFHSLMTLDLSYNQIKRIENLDCLAGTLCELYLVENRIKEVSGLEALTNLRLLELGGNRIRSIANHPFDTLVHLEQLWLGKNKITELGDAFVKLCSLQRLSLQANRIMHVGPESFPKGAQPALSELFLSENGLTSIENVSELRAMRLIDFSMNAIREIDEQQINPTNMPALEEFWITDNKIEEWPEVTKLAAFSTTLRLVYLERNPIERDTRYRDKVYRLLPFITQIDSWPLGKDKTNLEADRAIHRRGQ